MNAALILAVGAGLLSALPLLIAASEPGGLLLLVLAPLPLFLAGFAQGLLGATIAGGTLLVVAGLAAGLFVAFGALLFLVGPTLLLVRQALLSRPAAVGAGAATGGGAPGAGPGAGAGGPDLEWYPPGLLTTWLVWIGLAWLAVTLGLMLGEGLGLQTTVEGHLQRALGLTLPQATAGEVTALAASMSSFALGFGIVSYLLLLALNGALAQGALVRFGRNLRPSPDIARLRLPAWIAPALAAALVAAFLLPGDLGFIARNLAPILLVPFFFGGLAVAHAYARRARNGTLLLALFYVLLVLFTWPAAFVVLVGLFDQWADLRRRLEAAVSDREEE